VKVANVKLTPKKVSLEQSVRDTRLFSTKEDTALSFRSGLVILAKGEGIGKHDTESQEEMLIILKGEGELITEGNNIIRFKKNEALYIPPHTLHDVKNTGKSSLKYVFITANVAY
jgi:mannose-6-phosphate isomerase-like protein (cupin superfamily)